MIALPSLSQLDRASSTRIWLCMGPTDMRRGFDRLAEQAHTVTRQPTTLPDDIGQLKAMIAQYQATIATLTQQRDEFYLKSLQLEVRLAKALKQAYGPRANRIQDSAQMLLDFGQKLEALPVHPTDLPPEEEVAEPAAARRPVSRRIRTRGRRDIGSLDHLPMVEQKYELTGDLCRCPACQRHGINPQVYLTQLLAGIQDTPISQLNQWLTDRWKAAQAGRSSESATTPSPTQPG